MDLANIQKRIEQIDNFSEENKISKGMLKAELENDTEYLESLEEIKAALAKRKRLREEILAKPENQKLIASIKDNTEELTTLKDILSLELMQVYEEEKTDQVTDSFGETRKFKLMAKLTPKKTGKQNRDDDGKFTDSEN